MEKTVKDRHNYSEKIRGEIESLKCVNCKKNCNGREMVTIDGVELCMKNAWGRRVFAKLESKEDFESIGRIADNAYLQ